LTDYQALARRFDDSTYARFLGMKVEELADGFAIVSLTLAAEHCNWKGYVHGGVLMSLADHAFGCAANTEEDRVYIAVHFDTRLISAPAVGTRLLAEGRVAHAGRTINSTEIVVRDERGRLVATASGTAIAVAPLPDDRASS
jgi:acyl-CoA thioesterase